MRWAQGSHRRSTFAVDNAQNISEPACQEGTAAGAGGHPSPPPGSHVSSKRCTCSQAQRRSLVPVQTSPKRGQTPWWFGGQSLPDHKEKQRPKQFWGLSRLANSNGPTRLVMCYWSSSLSPEVLLWWKPRQITSATALPRPSPHLSVFQAVGLEETEAPPQPCSMTPRAPPNQKAGYHFMGNSELFW